jgi:hypothetical protein
MSPHRLLRLLRPLLLTLPLLAGACDDEAPAAGPDAATPANDAAPSTDTAAADATGADAGADGSSDASPDAGAVTSALGLVVVHSDYKTTLVSLVDPATGTVTKDDCINSGSKPAQLTTTLSGDVVVPTQVQPGNQLVLIDRQNATLTWVAPGTCAVVRQVNIGGGKMVNPQDVIPVSDKKAYVTRYAAEASDLLVIDPSTGTTGASIDLEPSAPMAGATAVLANPSRGLIAGGKVYVVLTALSADSKVGAPGRVVVVDPGTDKVTGAIDLPTLKNCGSIAAVGTSLVVACGGVYLDPNQLADSGVAWIDTTTTPPAVKVAAAKDFGRALSPFDAAAVSSSLAFAITGGDFSGMPPDQLWSFDFAGGAPRKILEGKGAFTLSGLLADDAHKKLFVADGDAKNPRLQILDLSNPATVTVQSSLITNAGGLPPRYVSWY